MAQGRKSSARKGTRGTLRRWMLRLVALAVLTGFAFAAWLWWDMREWRPDEDAFPEQGAAIASGGAGTRFETIRALGGDRFRHVQEAVILFFR
jgi:lysozyme